MSYGEKPIAPLVRLAHLCSPFVLIRINYLPAPGNEEPESLAWRTLLDFETVTSQQQVQCPYCGETFETEMDASGGSQEYIEDCYVCCRPILFRVEVDVHGELMTFEARREND